MAIKTVLGLDIGTNSIGWVLLRELADSIEFVTAGVRIVSDTNDFANEFEQGKAITLNANRRQKRSLRRGYQRRKHRKSRLKSLLEANGMLPGDDLMHLNIPKREGGAELDVREINPLYRLRDRAVREQISLQELGRVLIHLNQKRGYKSNRLAISEEETKSDYLKTIQDRQKDLAAEQLTPGQDLYHRLNDSAQPGFHTRNRIYLRRALREEFDRMWATQRAFYPDVLTDALYKEIGDRTIFYQRPLKSAKHLRSDCTFEHQHKAAPKSHLLAQAYRLYQRVNDLRIKHHTLADEQGYDRMGVRELTQEERKQLIDYLWKTPKKKAKKSHILKLLGLNSRHHTLNFEELETLQTRALLLEAFKEHKENKLLPLLDFDPLQSLEEQPIHHIWELLSNIADPEILVKNLCQKYGTSKDLAKEVSKINFKAEYGSLSVRAIKRLLPFMIEGRSYAEVCETVYKATGIKSYHQLYETQQEQLDRQPLTDAVSAVKRGSLRNPVVEQIVEQVRHLVNAIISDESLVSREDRLAGRFEIRVETARELKASQKHRAAATKNNRDRQKTNEKLREELKASDIRPTSRNLLRYKLWLEAEKESPYSMQPISKIPFAHIFDDRYYEVDHIIPRSRFFDDSFNNKVLVETKENSDKGNRTAYEYMESKGQLAAFERWVRQHKGFSKRKKENLLADAIPEDFVQRQLKETQYINRYLLKKLGEVCHTVTPTTGKITAYLRKRWGLDDLLQSLNLDRYKAAGAVKTTENKHGKTFYHIEEWGKRSDHRHHAVDALVVALTSRSIIQRLNTLHARQNLPDSWHVPPPIDRLVSRAEALIEGISVSHRQRNRVATKSTNRYKHRKHNADDERSRQRTSTPRGGLHDETVYGRIKVQRKVAVSPKFDTEWIDNMPIAWQRDLLIERLDAHGGDPKKAFKKYSSNPITIPHNKKTLTHVTIIAYEITARYAVGPMLTTNKVSRIVDQTVKRIVTERLAAHGNNPKKAFENLEENPLLHKNGHPIKSVVCTTGITGGVALYTNEKGKPVSWVNPRNNHHVALYRSGSGLSEQVVSFWTAVERVNQGQSVFLRETPDGQALEQILQRNDYFIIGLKRDEIDLNTEQGRKLVAHHLYRVQSLSSSDYIFRRHTSTDSKLNKVGKDSGDMVRIRSLKAFGELAPIKAKVDRLGRIRLM